MHQDRRKHAHTQNLFRGYKTDRLIAGDSDKTRIHIRVMIGKKKNRPRNPSDLFTGIAVNRPYDRRTTETYYAVNGCEKPVFVHI